ncbi:HET-domain-containing protein [Bimuria novae-zelandiae CBS 107.79]|uniref:HET-domain-containing protein n=1 Tax=Bimuria novae-zelandiae CBS 107.79 TaxID=1447943 RepID=A0A6A5USS6_9PLEO|nr:HET-domain-containing protein [Bimuria novae-zelandiae CBS 107.79]
MASVPWAKPGESEEERYGRTGLCDNMHSAMLAIAEHESGGAGSTSIGRKSKMKSQPLALPPKPSLKTPLLPFAARKSEETMFDGIECSSCKWQKWACDGSHPTCAKFGLWKAQRVRRSDEEEPSNGDDAAANASYSVIPLRANAGDEGEYVSDRTVEEDGMHGITSNENGSDHIGGDGTDIKATVMRPSRTKSTTSNDATGIPNSNTLSERTAGELLGRKNLRIESRVMQDTKEISDRTAHLTEGAAEQSSNGAGKDVSLPKDTDLEQFAMQDESGNEFDYVVNDTLAKLDFIGIGGMQVPEMKTLDPSALTHHYPEFSSRATDLTADFTEPHSISESETPLLQDGEAAEMPKEDDSLFDCYDPLDWQKTESPPPINRNLKQRLKSVSLTLRELKVQNVDLPEVDSRIKETVAVDSTVTKFIEKVEALPSPVVENMLRDTEEQVQEEINLFKDAWQNAQTMRNDFKAFRYEQQYLRRMLVDLRKGGGRLSKLKQESAILQEALEKSRLREQIDSVMGYRGVVDEMSEPVHALSSCDVIPNSLDSQNHSTAGLDLLNIRPADPTDLSPPRPVRKMSERSSKDFVHVKYTDSTDLASTYAVRKIPRPSTKSRNHCAKAGLQCDCYQPQISINPLSPRFDFGKVHKWRAQCEATHGDCCNDRYSDALAQQLDSLLLVDVMSGHLVTLPTSTKFVALSYVWGNVTMLKSVKANIEKLKEPGALFREPFKSALPETIRDAMHAVLASGEKYLWVDCLSIIQDSEKEDMEKMLQSMARIYASAEFTIVAAQGHNAKFGLRGAGGPYQDRTTAWSTPDACDDGGSGFPWHSRWASRGWTFQETLFSRRLLIFDTFVSWICGRHIRREHEPVRTEVATAAITWPYERPHLGIPMGMMSLIPNKPSLGRWGMIIENFSSRDLTFENDTSRALAGATEVMAATFPGGVHHGLPLFFFDIALLWQPKTNLERRHGEPSWSWKGWKGHVSCLSPWQPFFPGVYRKSGLSTDWVILAPLKPLATWTFTTREDSHAVENDYMNGFYHYQAMRSNSKCTLPPGWERHSHADGDYFTDDKFATTGFRYAYPLPSTEDSWKSAASPSTPILTCTAPVAMLTFGHHVLFFPSVVRAVMHGDTIIGLVTPNQFGPDAQPGQSCKLVALSQATISDARCANEHPQLGDYCSAMCSNMTPPSSVLDPGDHEFLNVLWVEEKDGVAYRKGLGIVSRRYWSEVGAEVETVMLG